MAENGAEKKRIKQRDEKQVDWGRWGVYLPDRQWGTVREDYSANGDAWASFPFSHAHLRTYRWGEDGLLGFSDRKCRLCFSFAFWNRKDPILKERLFGLTNAEGNHGEDVKELYFFLEGTPTFSYQQALYKYPISQFPYDELKRVNRERSRTEPEYEIEETGVFDRGHFDLEMTYAKAGPEDILIRLTVTNRADVAAPLTILPSLWFRNTWSWGRISQEVRSKPCMRREGGHIVAQHETLGSQQFIGPEGSKMLFTENESNTHILYRQPCKGSFTKDAFNRYVVDGESAAVNPEQEGTKAAYLLEETFEPGESRQFDFRLRDTKLAGDEAFGRGFESTLETRAKESAQFWHELYGDLSADQQLVCRQSMAGLIWSRKFYYYCVPEWIEGDPAQPRPPEGREHIRNGSWTNVYARDCLLMPDAWEYPWFAAWDLAFHAVALAPADPGIAKQQVLLLCREWYMKNNGQLPAYEWEFSDVNPPVQAWAAWRIFEIEKSLNGEGDTAFLERVFQKLLLNFTWWVNRKDSEGNNLFSGGFLGLDNIGVFDRSKGLPGGGRLEQADGTAWAGIYCIYMLEIAIELAHTNPVYEDMASKFFEHFVEIIDAMNDLGGGLWDEEDGFYYDRLLMGGHAEAMKIHSMVGLLPLLASGQISSRALKAMPGFRKRLEWFLRNRKDLSSYIDHKAALGEDVAVERFLSLVPRDRVERIAARLFDESEFLSPFGIRSLSKWHEKHPFVLDSAHGRSEVGYLPGESDNGLFGGNSNWRGPVWLPVNFLLVEALKRFHTFYGNGMRAELPAGSGTKADLNVAALEVTRRLCSIFEEGPDGKRVCMGRLQRFSGQPGWENLLLFHEYFHADSGEGLGASHQTGWTALVALLAQTPGLNAAHLPNRKNS